MCVFCKDNDYCNKLKKTIKKIQQFANDYLHNFIVNIKIVTYSAFDMMHKMIGLLHNQNKLNFIFY